MVLSGSLNRSENLTNLRNQQVVLLKGDAYISGPCANAVSLSNNNNNSNVLFMLIV